MEPISATIMAVLSLASMGFSIGKQNQANLKARRDGDAAVDAARKASEAERLALDAQYLADRQTALATAEAARIESEAKAVKLKKLTRFITFMSLGLTLIVVLKYVLDRRS